MTSLLALLACGPDEPEPPKTMFEDDDDDDATDDVPWDTQEWSPPSYSWETFTVDCPTPPDATLPLAYPLAPLSPTQVEEVRSCDVIDQFYEYAEAGSACPVTACEWAAAAITQVYTDPYSYYQTAFPEAETSLAEALTANPGFLLDDIVLGTFWPTEKVTGAPAPAGGLTEVRISYSWTGYGDPVAWDVVIADADTAPVATGTVDGEPWNAVLDVPVVQALGGPFPDLVPIEEWVEATPCWDLYPDWTMSLTYGDGTTLELATHATNFAFAGGPWQLELDGQRWLQASPAQVIPVVDLAYAAGLPFGEPAIFGCGEVLPPMIEQAFP